jgi:hypothetical protein
VHEAGPPVHAYDAPTLMIEPGVPAAMCRRPNSRAQRNVPLSVMSIDRAPRVRRHVLGRHREVRGRVVDEHGGQPDLGFGRVERGGDLLGVAMSHADRRARAPMASIASRPASRCSGLRLAITIAAPEARELAAIALPRPVPRR